VTHTVFKGYSLGAVDYLPAASSTGNLNLEGGYLSIYLRKRVISETTSGTIGSHQQFPNSGKVNSGFSFLSACSPVGIFLIDIEGNLVLYMLESRSQAMCGSTLEDNFMRALVANSSSRRS